MRSQISLRKYISKIDCFQVFLQRLANHPSLKNDRNLHVFLEYEQVKSSIKSFPPLHSLLLGLEREGQKQEGEAGRHLQLFPKDRSLVLCLHCWSCRILTRRWTATFQHSEGRGWIFRAWKGLTSFFSQNNGITPFAPGQVYLIEYNQQMKDACIKSDKMTSTHKVVDLEDKKRKILFQNHESLFPRL